MYLFNVNVFIIIFWFCVEMGHFTTENIQIEWNEFSSFTMRSNRKSQLKNDVLSSTQSMNELFCNDKKNYT